MKFIECTGKFGTRDIEWTVIIPIDKIELVAIRNDAVQIYIAEHDSSFHTNHTPNQIRDLLGLSVKHPLEASDEKQSRNAPRTNLQTDSSRVCKMKMTDGTIRNVHLWDANPNCEHEELANNWSDIRCSKCTGWYCL